MQKFLHIWFGCRYSKIEHTPTCKHRRIQQCCTIISLVILLIRWRHLIKQMNYRVDQNLALNLLNQQLNYTAITKFHLVIDDYFTAALYVFDKPKYLVKTISRLYVQKKFCFFNIIFQIITFCFYRCYNNYQIYLKWLLYYDIND